MKNRLHLRHFFLPHPHTHQKAHLLSWQFLTVYVFLFLALQFGFNLLESYNPGVLGTSSSITIQRIIEETNKERQAQGLSPLRENPSLNQAATAKAGNMFEEDYWAHFSPSGKDPWGFIVKAGYKFVYAGENLARNFSNSEDVVRAWMNSPSHRDNILNPNYQDIGIAVEDGVLNGQQTTLVVQMFGKPAQLINKPATTQKVSPVPVAAVPKIDAEPLEIASELIPELEDRSKETIAQTPEVKHDTSVMIAGAGAQPRLSGFTIDPVLVTRTAGIFIISLIAFLLIVDFVIIKRRGVYRTSSHHIAHLSFLAITTAAVIFSRVGNII